MEITNLNFLAIIVAAALGITYLYEGKSLRLFLINAGYQAVTITIMGGIIGIWQ